jgi:hypothetical protein
MGKKIAIGCAVVLVLAVAASAVGFYFFVWKPGGEMVRQGVEIARSGKDFAAGFARLGEIAELDEEIEDTTPYDPPADDVLSAEQVERFVGVQRQVESALRTRLDDAEASFEELKEKRNPSPAELARMLNELTEVAVEAKKVQVEALNEAGFSRQEYAWTKRQVYLALGLGNVQVDLPALLDAVKSADAARVQDEMEKLTQPGGDPDAAPVVPPENVALVEPYRDSLQNWAPLAGLGL